MQMSHFVNAGRLGAQVPMHDRNMETTKEGIYVAGDSSGVEEASSAIEEGKLAGIAAAEALGKLSKEEAAKAKENVWNSLDQLEQDLLDRVVMMRRNRS